MKKLRPTPGLGSTEYDPKEFCGPARRCERLLRKLGASRVASAELDDAENDGDERYEAWYGVQSINFESVCRRRVSRLWTIESSDVFSTCHVTFQNTLHRPDRSWKRRYESRTKRESTILTQAWERRAVAAFCRPFPVARADPEYVAKRV